MGTAKKKNKFDIIDGLEFGRWCTQYKYCKCDVVCVYVFQTGSVNKTKEEYSNAMASRAYKSPLLATTKAPKAPVRRQNTPDRAWLYVSIVANILMCLGFVYFRTPSLPDGRRAVVAEVGTTGGGGALLYDHPTTARRRGGPDADEENIKTIAEALRKSSETLEEVRTGNYKSKSKTSGGGGDKVDSAGGAPDRVASHGSLSSIGGEIASTKKNYKKNDEGSVMNTRDLKKPVVGFSALDAAGAVGAAQKRSGGDSSSGGGVVGSGGGGHGESYSGGGGDSGGGRWGSTAGNRRRGDDGETAHPRPQSQSQSQTVQNGGSPPWLTIGIPTAPRNQDVDYLSVTLQTLLAELPDNPSDKLFGKIRVIVMNTKPGRHDVYDDVRRKYQGEGSRMAKTYLNFVDHPGTYGDPTPNKPDPDDLHNPGNVPGHAVRQQTADLATLIHLSTSSFSDGGVVVGGGAGQYFMFMEDDFKTCAGTIGALRYLLDKADAVYPTWLGVRLSYGMNGVVMRSDDLKPFADYLAEHVSRQPPDILWREWVEGNRPDVRQHTGGRRMMVYRYNLMEHVGSVSTFAVRPNRPKWPGCYDSMTKVWSLSAGEKFDEGTCKAVDLSPCTQNHGVNMNNWGETKPSFAWDKT